MLTFVNADLCKGWPLLTILILIFLLILLRDKRNLFEQEKAWRKLKFEEYMLVELNDSWILVFKICCYCWLIGNHTHAYLKLFLITLQQQECTQSNWS